MGLKVAEKFSFFFSAYCAISQMHMVSLTTICESQPSRLLYSLICLQKVWKKVYIICAIEIRLHTLIISCKKTIPCMVYHTVVLRQPNKSLWMAAGCHGDDESQKRTSPDKQLLQSGHKTLIHR